MAKNNTLSINVKNSIGFVKKEQQLVSVFNSQFGSGEEYYNILKEGGAINYTFPKEVRGTPHSYVHSPKVPIKPRKPQEKAGIWGKGQKVGYAIFLDGTKSRLRVCDKGDKVGFSIKPSNIRLNAKKAFYSIPEAIIMGAGLNSSNGNKYILIGCASLLAWKTLKDCMTVEISPDQAKVMYALWKEHDKTKKKRIPLEEGFVAVNSRYYQGNMKRSDYEKIIDELVAIGCIELIEGEIILKEGISRKIR